MTWGSAILLGLLMTFVVGPIIRTGEQKDLEEIKKRLDKLEGRR